MAHMRCCFFSKALMRTVDISVILPTDKETFGGAPDARPRRFKTLYLLHGIFGSCDDWLHGTRIQRWAQDRDLAVVMPSGENKFYVDRPFDASGKFIGEDLVEFTRRSFPLSDRREDTFIGGLSMGGYGAIRNGLVYGDIFGAIIGLSSALNLDGIVRSTYDAPGPIGNRRYYESVFGDLDALPGSDMDYRALIRRRLAEGKPIPAMYLACGTEDAGILPGNEAFHAFLAENGVAHTYVTAPGTHNWDFWDAFLLKALDWLPLNGVSQGVGSGNVGLR